MRGRKRIGGLCFGIVFGGGCHKGSCCWMPFSVVVVVGGWWLVVVVKLKMLN